MCKRRLTQFLSPFFTHIKQYLKEDQTFVVAGAAERLLLSHIQHHMCQQN